uniref:Uncharacterized protein n=1 Tax=Arundo donax TaxID=35708 RepID=A0A0A8Y395_ARUDO
MPAPMTHTFFDDDRSGNSQTMFGAGTAD